MFCYSHSHPKTPYASVLFGDTPAETRARAKAMRARNFVAAKFGWGPIGRGGGRAGAGSFSRAGWGPIGRAGVRADAEHFAAAREGLGDDGVLLVDTGQIFIADVERAAQRLP